jgi:hypothetical protein
MKQLFKTLSGREFTVTQNKKNRTYTFFDGTNKYRTSRLGKIEFDSMEYFTAQDWVNYLRNYNDYETV